MAGVVFHMYLKWAGLLCSGWPTFRARQKTWASDVWSLPDASCIGKGAGREETHGHPFVPLTSVPTRRFLIAPRVWPLIPTPGLCLCCALHQEHSFLSCSAPSDSASCLGHLPTPQLTTPRSLAHTAASLLSPLRLSVQTTLVCTDKLYSVF